MAIRQVSVFIENQKGALANALHALSDAGIELRALSIADTSDFGILRVIVDRPKEAVLALREHGMTVSLTNVLAVGITDEKGAFSKVIRVLANGGIDVEYIYAFVSRDKGKAYVIIRTDKSARAAEVLTQHGVELLSAEDLYNM